MLFFHTVLTYCFSFLFLHTAHKVLQPGRQTIFLNAIHWTYSPTVCLVLWKPRRFTGKPFTPNVYTRKQLKLLKKPQASCSPEPYANCLMTDCGSEQVREMPELRLSDCAIASSPCGSILLIQIVDQYGGSIPWSILKTHIVVPYCESIGLAFSKSFRRLLSCTLADSYWVVSLPSSWTAFQRCRRCVGV